MAGLYIHIPFCKSRCVYCGFYSTTHPDWQDRYTDALCKELELRKDYLQDHLRTVYIGGGTPSLLSMENLRRLFLYINKVYGMQHVTETTIEVNPDDVTEAFARQLRQLPVNRISMGVQSFNDEQLRFLHRRHTSRQAHEAIRHLRDAGFDNISIDLMFGFPGETMAVWEEDLRQAVGLHVEHLSAYDLMYEEGTPLHRALEEGRIEPNDEDTCLAMYETLLSTLEAHGYEHYEISNFAKRAATSRRSAHNSSYWRGIPYMGIGAGAHSFDLRSRQWNVSDITAYMEAIEAGRLPMEREVLDADTRYNDLVATALRTCEGIDFRQLSDSHKAHLLHCAQPFLLTGELERTPQGVRLTRKGLFVSDMVMAQLVKV